MQIAGNRADHEGPSRLNGSRLEEWPEVNGNRLHRLCRHEHLGNEHFVPPEFFADTLHSADARLQNGFGLDSGVERLPGKFIRSVKAFHIGGIG